MLKFKDLLDKDKRNAALDQFAAAANEKIAATGLAAGKFVAKVDEKLETAAVKADAALNKAGVVFDEKTQQAGKVLEAARKAAAEEY